MHKFELGLLGGGNMATAIVDGVIRSGVLTPDKIIVSDPSRDRRDYFNAAGVKATDDNAELFTDAEYILLAVKPQVAAQILGEYNGKVQNKFISIMAGFSKAKIKSLLGEVKVARIMPNTAAMVGEAMSAIDSTEFNAAEREFLYNIFNTLGKAAEIPENMFDAVTAVSGSGPAYIYMFIKAMIDGGIAAGLSEEDSKTLTLQTVIGGVKMVKHNSDTPIDTLIDRVCSKGGTTIQAVDYYRDKGLEDIIIEGMKRCKARSEELGRL